MSNLTFTVKGAAGPDIPDSFEVALGQAIDTAFADAIKTAYEKVSDLGVQGWAGSEDITLAAATTAETGSSREVTWGLKVLKNGGGTFTHDMMQPKEALITGDVVNVAHVSITGYANAYVPTGKMTLSNGENMAVGGIIRGRMNRRTRKHSKTKLPK